mmetsp:Transcript_239/g.318  ORF Transcript_239/g.318 Transcript_239/m.318 type:complete len:138 (-) Transcript_239:88-501(-)|eukprot:CAMPEP_0194769444 /NCGR_PEP_ID=MMETSP0323_2-20130528/43119_1 /TAXON_ID=2866 ORGANISM="Crypthecodinium cohnii, Strain Seligo" /NCGR_SAMPLE_ID=MMETSP0323_2 /ASSEMBLY_ACC=CAM_ASM_000346 /LENGTH=137 /DNA_ID=CAMNT_0039702421 /DNA_START=59 /DNA_END=472 /DNA_ORIENTATION=-
MSAPKAKEELTPQQIQQAYQQIEKECSTYLNKIAELEQEVNEHNLVLKAFEKVEPTRRCFRMVGGVLVERTVAEVQPAIKQNVERVQQVTKTIETELKKKTQQRSEFIQKYGLNKGSAAAANSGSQARKAGGGSVLV